MRRAHALHPPAFLIDQDGRLSPDRCRANPPSDAASCSGVSQFRWKQDKAPRLGRVFEKRRFLGAKGQARRAREYTRPSSLHSWTTGMQLAPSATSTAQNRRASARLLEAHDAQPDRIHGHQSFSFLDHHAALSRPYSHRNAPSGFSHSHIRRARCPRFSISSKLHQTRSRRDRRWIDRRRFALHGRRLQGHRSDA